MDFTTKSAGTSGAMTTVKALTIVLSKPEEWHAWLEMLKDRAETLDIWEYIDPALTEQPIQPAKPNAPARTDTELTWYKLDLQQYKEFKKATNQINEILAQTVSRFYHSSTRGKPTLWAKLRALQDQCEPNEFDRQYTLINKLNRLREGPTRAGTDQWLNEWQDYLVDATEINLPDIQNGRIQLDFLSAVEKVNQPWARMASYTYLTSKKGERPTLLDLISEYRSIGNLVHTEKAIRKGAYYTFSAQDGFEDVEDSAETGQDNTN